MKITLDNRRRACYTESVFKMREEVNIGDLVVYREEFEHIGGLGLVVGTNPMYAFVKWANVPGTFIANKEHLELVSESR